MPSLQRRTPRTRNDADASRRQPGSRGRSLREAPCEHEGDPGRSQETVTPLPQGTGGSAEALRDQRQLAQGRTARLVTRFRLTRGIYTVHSGQQGCFLQKQRKNALSPQTSEDQGRVGSKRKRRGGRREGLPTSLPSPPSILILESDPVVTNNQAVYSRSKRALRQSLVAFSLFKILKG